MMNQLWSWKPLVVLLLMAGVAVQFAYMMFAEKLPVGSAQNRRDAVNEPIEDPDADSGLAELADPSPPDAALPTDAALATPVANGRVSEAGSEPELKPDAGSDGQRAPTEATEETIKSTMGSLVQVLYEDDELAGSGVVISKSDDSFEFLTAAHVVQQFGKDEFRVAFQTLGLQATSSNESASETQSQPDAKGLGTREATSLRATVVTSDATTDLAVCRVQSAPPPATCMHLVTEASTQTPFAAFRVKYAFLAKPELIPVRVIARKNSVRKRSDRPVTYWVIDSESESGVSGGPLVDQSGRLLGIASGNSGGQAYFVTESEVAAFRSSEH